MQRNKIAELRHRSRDRELRIQRYGPEPPNPFTQLRTRAGLNLGELMEVTGIDRRALSRTEHGLYTKPLPNLMAYWIRQGSASEGQMISDYYDYQDAQRARHYHYFGEDLSHEEGSVHPFRLLRHNRPSLATGSPLPVGLQECCEALCLPLDTIQFFEKKYRLQQSVPKGLLNVLNQIGYRRQQIDAFESDYELFRSVSRVKVV